MSQSSRRPAIAKRANTAFAGTFLLLTALCALNSGCGEKKVEGAAAPPLEVEVVKVTPQDVPITKEWVATLKGLVNTDIRAQVSGYLLKQDYTNGAYVDKGTLLFEIDTRPFQATLSQQQANLAQAKGAVDQSKAALEQAKAEQQRAEAELGKTQIDVTRYTPLAKVHAISQQELDTAVQQNLGAKAQVEAAKANVATASANIVARQASVAAAEAAVENAQLNLGFTKVTSQIAGIAGISNAQVGDLVGPQSPTPLTTVSTADPILAQFSASEQEYLNAVRASGGNLGPDSVLNKIVFELILADGTMYPQKGKLQYVDREIDVKTGSINVQIAFPNPGNVLRPGGYGTVRAVVRTEKNALTVPQRALTELQGRFMAAIVGPDGKVAIRQVTAGQQVGSLWVVSAGLSAGDNVVAEGIQKVRDGMQVNAKPYQPPAATAPQ
jgi:membrane fusion protein (multidrug efflux system)